MEIKNHEDKVKEAKLLYHSYFGSIVFQLFKPAVISEPL
jgi:hypothetical protein